jgi:glycosyltransferase involved in cell wall biosynthesis/SAM-dependent methyltransferase
VHIAIVGPTHPIKGGVAQHTTMLARRLAEAGHDVRIVSWRRQYPSFLYPGHQTVDAPELSPFTPTERILSWNRPDTWIRTARRLRGVDLVVFAHVTPVQVAPYWVMLRGVQRARAKTVVICHNVLPHESRRFDRPLVRALLRASDQVLVHSSTEAETAAALTDAPIEIATLPPAMPDGFIRRRPLPGEHRRLIFFGIVRPYKGLDVALRALAAGPPDVQLRVAGEFWGGTDATEELCAQLGIAHRVELRNGYVRADDVPSLFADVDALLVPYRTATGSQAVWAGFEFGVPVITTRAGHLADDVRDGVDGVVAQPDDVDSLRDALYRFYQREVPERMREQVRPVDPQPHWDAYLKTLLDCAGQDSSQVDVSEPGLGQRKAAAPGGRALHAAKIAAEEVLWARVAVQRALAGRRSRSRRPQPVAPTDILRTHHEYEAAVRECRRLRVPLHPDRPKNWDALGAVSTIVNRLGTEIRVLDAGSARYSPVLPWLRLLGVRRLVGNNLEFRRVRTHGPVRFEPGDITQTDYPTGSFDAVTCMSVIEHGVPLPAFAAETARILRPGGVLIVSTDYDQEPPATAGLSAYGVPVHIFGPSEIRAFVAEADRHGLRLLGELVLEHAERPVHWKRVGLDYTFIRLSFERTAD